jgi:hypothetical protein
MATMRYSTRLPFPVLLAFLLLGIQVIEGLVPLVTLAPRRTGQLSRVPPARISKPLTDLQALKMTVEGDFDADAVSKARDEAKSGSAKARIRALYKFTRPHTIRGTILASIAGTTRALVDTPGAIADANWGTMLPRAFIGMVALLLGNAFIVGINQIYDKDIDELNKPFLPVASGEMSKRAAWIAVIASGGLGPILVYVANVFGRPLCQVGIRPKWNLTLLIFVTTTRMEK